MNNSEKNIDLGNSDLNAFCIVTPKSANVLESQFANHLAFYIKSKFGYELTVSDDSTQGEYEILVGNTSRTDIKPKKNGFAVAFKNKSVELEIASSRSGKFIKDVWKNKYKVSATKTKLENHD